MDFGNAIVLTGAIFGVTELLKSLLPAKLKTYSQISVLLVLIASFAMVFLVGATAWAHTQIIGEVAMDKMSTADKILIALLLGGGAGVFRQGFTALKSVGQNQPTDQPAASTDPNAMQINTGTFPGKAP